MPDEQKEPQERKESTPRIDLDPVRMKAILDRLRSEQNFFGGLLAGLIAAAVGAGVWAAVTVATGYQIGWMAVGVGFLVGLAIRKVGKGLDKSFGVMGAILALLGCGAGNLLAVCGVVARHEGVSFFRILSVLNFQRIGQIMSASFSPMDVLFYAIAVYEGYKFSFRRLSEVELRELAGPV